MCTNSQSVKDMMDPNVSSSCSMVLPMIMLVFFSVLNCPATSSTEIARDTIPKPSVPIVMTWQACSVEQYLASLLKRANEPYRHLETAKGMQDRARQISTRESGFVLARPHGECALTSRSSPC